MSLNNPVNMAATMLALSLANPFKPTPDELEAYVVCIIKRELPAGTPDETVYMIAAAGGEHLVNMAYRRMEIRHMALYVADKGLPAGRIPPSIASRVEGFKREQAEEAAYLENKRKGPQPRTDLTPGTAGNVFDCTVSSDALPDEARTTINELSALGASAVIVEDTPEGIDVFIQRMKAGEIPQDLGISIIKEGLPSTKNCGGGKYDLIGKNHRVVLTDTELAYAVRKVPVA